MEDRGHDQATYLWVAETILRQHRRPLTARQIVNFGLERGLFADNLSRTPQKSMQARLSLDILGRGNDSRFLRTGRGKFFLRALLGEASVRRDNSEPLTEYTAVRRAPAPPSEQVLVIPRHAYETVLTFQGIEANAAPVLTSLLNSGHLTHIPRTAAELDPDYKQFVTYTIIQQRDRILSFRRGRYNRAASFLRGARCVGFGGHVTEDDLDIFTHQDRGIRANAAREISEEIKLVSGRPSINPNEIELLGILNDDSSDVGVRHVGIVMRFWAPEKPEWRQPTRGEASIAQLRWLPTATEAIDLLEFEYWSQLALRSFFPSVLTSRPSYRILRPGAFQLPHLLCVTGSVGSGKSVTTKRLCERAGYVQVNTGKVLARLLELAPVPDTPRDEFQTKAYAFISQPHGPERLAQAILDDVAALNHPRVIIDGLRQIETLERLREKAAQPVANLFVHTPPDIAYKLYVTREANGHELGLSEFMRIYNAPVESQVSLMIQEADAVIYNWFGLEDYELCVERFISEIYHGGDLEN